MVHTTDGKAYPVRFNLETGPFSQLAGPKIPDTKTSHTGFAHISFSSGLTTLFLLLFYMKRPFRKCMGCYLHIRIVFELLSCKPHLPKLWHFFPKPARCKRVKKVESNFKNSNHHKKALIRHFAKLE